MEGLLDKLNQLQKGRAQYIMKEARQAHGTGERGDKIRSYRLQDDIVTDHLTGRKTSLIKLYRGDFSEIK